MEIKNLLRLYNKKVSVRDLARKFGISEDKILELVSPKVEEVKVVAKKKVAKKAKVSEEFDVGAKVVELEQE